MIPSVSESIEAHLPEVSASNPPGGSRITLKRVSKRFGSFLAVDDLGLDVAGGEFITLLGPSGSGKSTTLAMIAGFEEPTAGDIFIDGKSVAGVPPYKRTLGVVFQHYALFPHMTAFDNVAFPLRMRGVTKSEVGRRVQEALAIVRLRGFEERFPRQLSGGQQQRVALARAIVFNPQALLMDEPLGSLDKKLRDEMELEIRRLHNQLGVTVIYVTHDQEEALTMSERIAVMNNGRIEQIGTPADVYELPETVFVASFIGESNFFRGEITEDLGQEVVVRTDTGTRLRATPRGELSHGQQVIVAVRAERAFFSPEEGDSFNSVAGILEEAIYVGTNIRFGVRLSDGQMLIVRRPGPFSDDYPRPGQRVRVGWSSAESVILTPTKP